MSSEYKIQGTSCKETKGVSPLALILAVVTFFLVAVLGVVLKYLDDQLSVQQIAWMRFLMGFVLLFSFSSSNERSNFSIKLIDWFVFLRAILGLIAFVCFVYSIRQMSLSVWTAVQFTNPLMLALFASLILGERLPLLRCVAIVAGFIGVVVIADPHGPVQLVPLMVLLFGCASAALSDIVVKKLSLKYSSNAIVLSFFAIASIVLAPFALVTWTVPTLTQWVLLFAVAILGLSTQLCLTRAFVLAPASIVAPFSYTSIVWSMFFGAMFFEEIPTTRETLGILFILLDGVLAYLSIFGKGMKRSDKRGEHFAVQGSLREPGSTLVLKCDSGTSSPEK